MSDPADLSEAIETAAAQPQTVSADGLLSTQRPIDDLIKADRYLQQKAAAGKPKNPAGIRITQLIPPGSV